MNPFARLRVPIIREEEMDAAELPPERYAKVLADLSRINALTLAPRPTLGFLDRVRARELGRVFFALDRRGGLTPGQFGLQGGRATELG